MTKFAIEHATAVFVLIFCIFIGGLLSYRGLPKEAAPDIAIPIVIVSTPYFGVSPTDIETLVTQPLEKEFKGLRGVKKMTSTSAESVSLVTIEFETTVDIDDALDKVREKVDKAKTKLPPDAEEPEVIEVNASDFPILIANISGDMDLARLKKIGEDIRDEIEKVPGVLRVDLSGDVEREIQVLVNPDALRRYKVSTGQIIGALQAENINLPGGSIELGSMKYLLRVPGEFEDLETIRNIIVKAPQGQQVLLSDVAVVKDTFKQPETYSRLNTWVTQPDGTKKFVSQPSISLAVVKRSGENLLVIADKTKVIIEQFKKRMASGVEVMILNDNSTFIRSSVHDLENNSISGMLLVLLVLFFFMGGARNALMVAISVPLSMLLTFITLSMLGITLNMVVLFALILALGMLVDNAIVIVENIYRHASEGKPIQQAALEGTQEVGWAVIASTFTTVGAFFPLVFWPGVTGSFMSYLPKTVIITLLSSLFIALIINPTVAAVFLRVKKDEAQEDKEFHIPDNIMYRMYQALLTWSLNHRVIVVIVAIVSLVGTFMAFGRHNAGVEFFPESTPEQFNILVEVADGIRLDSTNDVIKLVADPLDGKVENIQGLTKEERESIAKKLSEGSELVEAWIEDVGVKSGNAVGGGRAPHYGTLSVDLLAGEKQKSDPEVFMNSLRKAYEAVPGANVVIAKQAFGPPAGKAVNVEIIGEDLKEMAKIARMIRTSIQTIPGIIDLDDDIELSRPEIVVLVDRKRAKLAKLDTRSIASAVRTAINGTKATVFREGDEEFDITVRMPNSFRERLEDIQQMTIPNGDNAHIPLKEVAEVKIQGGTGSIRHKNQTRIASVSANAASGYLPADLLAKVQEKVKELPIPAGYTIRYAGENEDQAEAGAFLANALLLAVFLIAMILVTQFNSIAQPFIILASVLLSLIGVLWSLILFREPFGIIMTGIGVISLAGVVVNNSIVLIDYTNKLRERGMTRREALVMAGLVRFRPVLLTAITTILGLVPLVVGVSLDFVNQRIVVGGQSVDLWGPMAQVVSFGLLVATILTLIVVPVMYSLFDQMGDGFKKLTGRAVTQASLVVLVLMLAGGMAPKEAWAQVKDGEATKEKVVKDTTTKPKASDGTEVKVANNKSDATKDGEVPDEDTKFSTPTDVVVDGFKGKLVDEKLLKIKAKRMLTLKQVRSLVQRQNLDIKASLINISVADATLKKAYSTLFPSLNVQFATTVNDREIELDFTSNLPFDVPDSEPTIIQQQVDWSFVASASARLSAQAWPLLQQAYMNKSLTQLQIQLVRDELDYAAVQAYYNLLLTKQVMLLTAQQIASDKTNLDVTKRLQEAGLAKPFDITRAQIRISQTEKQLEQVRQSFLQLRHMLANLMHTKADFDVQQVAPLALGMNVKQLKDKSRSRAKIRLQKQSIDLSKKAHEEVYWQYLPTLNVQALARRARGTAFQPGEFVYSLSFTASWLLWDGGFREAELDTREARIVAAQYQQRKEMTQLDSDIESAYASYLSSKAQYQASLKQLELAQKGLDQSQKALRLGAARVIEVISAEDQLRFAEIAKLQEELKVQLAIRKLLYLAGQDEVKGKVVKGEK